MCVDNCISVGVWRGKKKAPGDKALTHAERNKTKLCIWEENNSHTLLRERIILGSRAAKKHIFKNDFMRPKENKEISVGRKQMRQMFFPDLSSRSGLPVRLRNSAWPSVI